MNNSEIEKTITGVEFEIAQLIRECGTFQSGEPYASNFVADIRAKLEESSCHLSAAHQQIKHDGSHKIY